jgi:Tfp pilus assembly protein PilP
MTTAVRSIRLLVCLAALAVAVPAYAQAKQADKKADAPAAPAEQPPAKKVDLPVPPPNFEYAPQGRRDPFISLVNRGKQTSPDGAAAAKRAEGVPGMLTGEITVRGIMQARGAFVAMVSGPDGKVYTVRAGDKLADGVIRQVTATSVVILQEVNDPLSLDKQR